MDWFQRPVVQVVRAARVAKVLPLWLLVVAGALVRTDPLQPRLLVVSLAGIVGASLAAMHLNVYTDAELDRQRTAELWAWVSANRDIAAALRGERCAAIRT